MVVTLICYLPTYARQTPDIVSRGLGAYHHSISKVSSQLQSVTALYHKKVSKLEKQIANKLRKQDSLRYHRLFKAMDSLTGTNLDHLSDSTFAVPPLYRNTIARFDSIRSALNFFQQYGLADKLPADQLQAMSKQFIYAQNLIDATSSWSGLLRQRAIAFSEQLRQAGMLKELKAYQQLAGYYQLQVNQYLTLIKDPEKVVVKLLGILKESSLFRDFFKVHSALAALFPSSEMTNAAAAGSYGSLQVRLAITPAMQQQLGAAGANSQLLQQQVSAMSSQLKLIKDKLSSVGDDKPIQDLPDFKPNTQKVKSFLSRLQVGTNAQSTKSNTFFPTTTDFGLSLGYKLSNKSTVGVGGSFKIGWGKDIKNIQITGQGVGLRSFVDVKAKGSFYLSGGLEYNYQRPFSAFQDLPEVKYWTPAGLVGVSKIISVNSKFFKKSNLQLLYNFLSKRSDPNFQPLVFRMGYQLSK